MAFHLSPRTACSLALVALLAACGGGGGDAPPADASPPVVDPGVAPPVVIPPVVVPPVVVPPVVATHTIGGSLSGMTGGLVLQNNAGDNLSPGANGSFTFATAVAEGATYAVTVRTNPPFQRCVVVNGSGTVGKADVSNLAVTCTSTGVVVSTFAGSTTGAAGSANGARSTATFSWPGPTAFDAVGNLLIADGRNSSLRKITPTDVVSTLATGLANPSGLLIREGRIFVVSHDAGKLYEVDAMTGVLTERSLSRALNQPWGLVADAAGNFYVSERRQGGTGQRISKIDVQGAVTTLAGDGMQGWVDGPGTAARFYNPAGLAIDAAGYLYLADQNNYRIRKISPAGDVTTLSGVGTRGSVDGPANTASFLSPLRIAIGRDGLLYVADNSMIRRVAADGTVSLVAGAAGTGRADGDANTARFNVPNGLAFDANNDLFVADSSNNSIRKITRD